MSDDLLAVVDGIARASSTLTCVRCGATILPNRAEPPVSLRLRATAAGWQTDPEILCRADAPDVVRHVDELRTLLAGPIDPTRWW